MRTRTPRNLVGTTINHLTVEAPASPSHNQFGHKLWRCRCTCGRTVERTTSNVLRSFSCGCTNRRGRYPRKPPRQSAPPATPAPVPVSVPVP
jgi:hypothetical protein